MGWQAAETQPEMSIGEYGYQSEVVCGKQTINVTLDINQILESAYQLYGKKLTENIESDILGGE